MTDSNRLASRRSRDRVRIRGVGLRTVEQLHLSGVSVVIVDDDPDLRLAGIVGDWGMPRIHKSAHLGDGLTEAGLDRAQAVVCVETSEVTTLEIALRVRELRPDVRLVVQMANPASVAPSRAPPEPAACSTSPPWRRRHS